MRDGRGGDEQKEIENVEEWRRSAKVESQEEDELSSSSSGSFWE